MKHAFLYLLQLCDSLYIYRCIRFFLIFFFFSRMHNYEFCANLISLDRCCVFFTDVLNSRNIFLVLIQHITSCVFGGCWQLQH